MDKSARLEAFWGIRCGKARAPLTVTWSGNYMVRFRISELTFIFFMYREKNNSNFVLTSERLLPFFKILENIELMHINLIKNKEHGTYIFK